MNKDIRMYGFELNPSAIKSINEINEKIENEKNSEELLKLRLQRFYKGLELSSNPYQRNSRTYFPY